MPFVGDRQFQDSRALIPCGWCRVPSPDSHPVAHPSAVFHLERDGWALLFNPDTAGTLALNPTGVLVWRLINGGRSAADIAASVRRHFRGVPQDVEKDVAALIEALAKEGFVGYDYEQSEALPS